MSWPVLFGRAREVVLSADRLEDEGFYEPGLVHVGQSTVRGIGQGLFASRFLPEGTPFATYGGYIFTPDGPPPSDYCMALPDGRAVNGEPGVEGTNGHMGMYINSVRGLGVEPNAVFEVVQDGARFGIIAVADEDIPAGREIFTTYGDDYWSGKPVYLPLDPEEEEPVVLDWRTKRRVQDSWF